MKKIFIPLLIPVLIAGCQTANEKSVISDDMAEVRSAMPTDQMQSEPSDMKPAASQQTGQIPENEPSSLVQKKIIRDGSMTLKVKDIMAVRRQVDSIVSALDGYIGSENFNSYEQESSYYITIRVPAAHFNRLVEKIEKGKGEVKSKDISARDVTEEFVDLEIRLANKRKFAERYTELLKKAATVKEMLEIEEYIRKIEEEIESTEGRLRYLTDQVSFSKLNLTLTQENEYKYIPRQARNFVERLRESLHKGWRGFITFLLAVLRIWPLWILAAIGWILYRRYKRRRKITTGFKKTQK